MGINNTKKEVSTGKVAETKKSETVLRVRDIKTEKKSAKETKTGGINFAALAEISATLGSKKDSLYKTEIFAGKNEKERKTLRRQIRNKRDAVISAFNSAPKNEREKIATAWKKFAESVYKDIRCIFEMNTTNDKASVIAEFQNQVNQIWAKEK